MNTGEGSVALVLKKNNQPRKSRPHSFGTHFLFFFPHAMESDAYGELGHFAMFDEAPSNVIETTSTPIDISFSIHSFVSTALCSCQ